MPQSHGCRPAVWDLQIHIVSIQIENKTRKQNQKNNLSHFTINFFLFLILLPFKFSQFFFY